MLRRNLEVPRAHAGEAVARILHDGLGVAHSVAKGLIDDGCVTVNGRPATAHGQRCQEGDVVEVRYDPDRRYRPHASPSTGEGFQVLHEDPEIVVVNKMPGVLSSPAPGAGDESLAERLAGALRSRGIRKPQVFVVHRLDRHTSGVLVLARSPRALESLAAQFESREAGRVYTAVVEGAVRKDRGTIISHILEDPRTLSMRSTPLRGAGKRAVTHFQVIEKLGAATVVRVRLETGRKHQIRIHFAEIGHPVIGDRRYGSPSTLVPRVALHAERLTFKHPRTLDTVSYRVALPEDMTRLIALLRRKGSEPPQRALGQAALAAGAGGAESRVATFPKGLVLLDPVHGWHVDEPSLEAGPGPTSPARVVPSPPARVGVAGRPGPEARQGLRAGPAARQATPHAGATPPPGPVRTPVGPGGRGPAADPNRRGPAADPSRRVGPAGDRKNKNRSKPGQPPRESLPGSGSGRRIDVRQGGRGVGGRVADTVQRGPAADPSRRVGPAVDRKNKNRSKPGQPPRESLPGSGSGRRIDVRQGGRGAGGAGEDRRSYTGHARDSRGRAGTPDKRRKNDKSGTERGSPGGSRPSVVADRGPRTKPEARGPQVGPRLNARLPQAGARVNARTPGGDATGAGASKPPSRNKKPWEFRKKGSALRRARRAKIATALRKARRK